MSSSDHWNSLAQQIGAEPSPEPAAPSPPPEASPRPVARKPEAAPRPVKKANWSQLANSLGLEVPDEPEAEPAPETPPPPSTSVEPTPRAPQVEFLGQAEPIGDLDWLMRRANPLDEVEPLSSGDVVDQEGTFQEQEFVEAELVDVELVDEHGESSTDDVEAGEREERPDGERRRRRRRRGGRRSRRSREGRATAPTADGESVPEGSDLESETISDAIEASLTAAAEGEDGGEQAGGDEEKEPRERKGRRRRRRRGRRKPEGAARPEGSSEGAEPADESADLHDDDDTSLDTADVPLGLDEDEHDEHLDKNSHRAIPSWDDAIGMIVAVNMEARAKSPRSSGPPRGRGRGRGGRGNHHRGNNGNGGR